MRCLALFRGNLLKNKKSRPLLSLNDNPVSQLS